MLDGSPELDELRDRLRSLIDQPNAFTVNPLLTSQQFERKARDRGLDVSLGALEALHRADMVRPLFGVDFGFPNTKDERQDRKSVV